jgi:hypothetical protein
MSLRREGLAKLTMPTMLACALGLSVAAPASAAVVPFPELPAVGVSTFANIRSGIRTLLVSGDTIYAGGNFRVTEGGVTRNNLAAFDFDGHLKPGFSVETEGPTGTVLALATDGKTLFVGGTFARMGLKRRLAAVDLATGVVNRRFTAHVAGTLDPEASTGVYALAVVTDRTVDPPVARLVVGGNFTRVNSQADNRSGVAALNLDSGDLDPAAFSYGVEGGYVSALVATADTVFMGGSFTGTQGRARSLVAMGPTGVLQSGGFSTQGQPVVSLDLDPIQNRLFAGGGGFSNRVLAFTATGPDAGRSLWRGPRVGGNVQSVHAFGGNLYFGFHDGAFIEPDPYKLAVVDAATGAFEVDAEHPGLTCADTDEERPNCWLPTLDNTMGQGFMGVWAITHVADAATGKARLIVGGEFTQIGGVANTRRMGIFQEP